MPHFKLIPVLSSCELQRCTSQITPMTVELPNPSKKFNVMDTGGVGGLLMRPVEQIMSEQGDVSEKWLSTCF